MSGKVRWGILSTGNIAHQFTQALQSLPDTMAVVTAVGSRSQQSADEFGQKYNIPNRHPTYEALAADPNVDIIYIATPHSHHHDNALLCLRHNKHILVEKAFTVNAKQAKEIFDLAKEKKLFVMEAMWTRFFPVYAEIRKLIADGTIGKVRFVNADMSFNASLVNRDDPNWRLYNPDLAGGSLLDVGIYSISFAYMIFGKSPKSIQSHHVKAETGVDAEATFLFAYDDGASALLSCSFLAASTKSATIVGEKGTITIPKEFHKPETYTVQLFGAKEPNVHTIPHRHNGMDYQAEAVTKHVHDKLLESPLMTTSQSLEIMHTMDTLRQQWGLKYPFEK